MITIDERFNLQGKVSVVIGGAGYLCSALAQALSESGMEVVVLDITERPESDGYLRCDVTSKKDLVRCRDEILKRHGRVDVLLNGAGTNAPTPFLEITEEEIQQILRTHLVGTIFCCQVFGEVMVKQRFGSIINFASVSMGPPLSKAFVYSAAKAGIANITQNLAREWGPFNVRVNALRPGFFPTDWSMKHFIDEERKAKILGHTPMGRFGKPEELIGAVLWLASDAASFVTGSIVTVDGGFTAMTI
ncbi:MAG: gluconate 5-dehydrogenase [Ignavibacteria bacterium RIFCSPLOWO2_12_FULL_56_21]|nr:MAG: gluconate 5-dehydrogenase [Ignavibacteria bacterium RIFCSPLOWO2_12_FULL_56_21]